MMQVKFLSVILLLALSLPFTYGGCSGGGGDGGGDPCAGPVPCLTDFGDTYYEFEDQLGDPAIILSDGIDVGFVGIYYHPHTGDPYTIVIVGPVISCHDGDMIDGAIDWNMNGEIEEGELLEPMDGGLNICNETLSLFDLFLLGESWHDHEWTYVGSGPLIAGIMTQEKVESPRDFLHELIQILNEK